jgi:hypothetical protein
MFQFSQRLLTETFLIVRRVHYDKKYILVCLVVSISDY